MNIQNYVNKLSGFDAEKVNNIFPDGEDLTAYQLEALWKVMVPTTYIQVL